MENMDGMDMMGAFSVQNAVSQHFRTGNLVIDYLINFTVLGLFGFITTTLFPYVRKWVKNRDPCFKPVRPQLKFVAKKSTSNYISGVTASVEFRAWLAKIREVIKDKDEQGQPGMLYQLQEFTAARSCWDDEEDKKKLEDPSTEWMPDQEDRFLVQESPIKIYCEFISKDVEETKGEKTVNVLNYVLQVYTPNKNNFRHLLSYHEELMKGFYAKKRLTLNTKPHIFELTGIDEETGNILWDQHEFSSTRRMEHVWFKQKDQFMSAYTNFLENEKDYKRRGDPYTFNALLYGTPGCGKTSLLKALVNHSVERKQMTHVFVISFAKIKDSPMLSRVIFNKEINGHYVPFNQRLIIFEDFDADGGAKVFKKRFKNKPAPDPLAMPTLVRQKSNPNERVGESKEATEAKTLSLLSATSLEKKEKDPLTLSAVLNVLDGINERSGQRCFWTTNACPPEDHFDAAFLRPGRMDMMIDFTKCNHEGIEYLVQAYYGGTKALKAELVTQVPEFEWSPAQVKQKCKESQTGEEALRRLIDDAV